jgi:hypothetical protein
MIRYEAFSVGIGKDPQSQVYGVIVAASIYLLIE